MFVQISHALLEEAADRTARRRMVCVVCRVCCLCRSGRGRAASLHNIGCLLSCSVHACEAIRLSAELLCCFQAVNHIFYVFCRQPSVCLIIFCVPHDSRRFCDDCSARPINVTCWIPLSNTGMATGCFSILVGSHLFGELDKRLPKSQVSFVELLSNLAIITEIAASNPDLRGCHYNS